MTEDGQINEKKLVRRAKKGDAEAFGLLYDHYLPKIYRFIFFKVMNQHEAEDICHHVFLNAWENIKSYKDIGHSFSSWIYRIARNAVIDHYRTQKTTTEITELANILPSDLDLHTAIGVRLGAERALQALSQLTDGQREVIVMRYVEELSNKEIAKILNKSNGAIRVLQHRALENLRDILEDPSKKIREA